MEESPGKRAVLDYVAAFNAGDMERLRALHTEDAQVHGVLGWGGMEKVIPIWTMLHETLAIELHVEEIVEQGDVVAVRYTERGRSAGDWRGQPATGKTYAVDAMEWFHIRDGRIHRRWGARDSAAIFRQLELQP
jgi:steroid delta-isomerase-like uncharacterized protein